jgi:hypothetical protein
MENHNTIRIEENKITLKYETETLTFEKVKNPSYTVKTQYINLEKERFFLTKRKP